MVKLYDRIYHASSIAAQNDIFIIGSSQSEFAIDPVKLEELTSLRVGIYSLPGSNMISRYYALKDRLVRHGLNPPKLVILETPPFVFNIKRYGDTLPPHYLIPYSYLGIMNEYIEHAGNRKPLSKLYSMNAEFDQLITPLNIFKTFLEPLVSNSSYSKIKDLFGRKNNKISNSKIQKSNREFSENPNPKLIEYFNKIIELTQKHHTKLILLDMFDFKFDEDKNLDFSKTTKDILKAHENKDTKYISINLGNNPDYFYDVYHLNEQLGRPLFTKQLAVAINEFLYSQ